MRASDLYELKVQNETVAEETQMTSFLLGGSYSVSISIFTFCSNPITSSNPSF